MHANRRTFLSDVGKGLMVAGLGPALAAELGVNTAWAEEGPEALAFGTREPLVRLLQETPADRLLPLLVQKIDGGTSLQDLVAAAALANVRTFGGEDYIGFHTMMALGPALEMAGELPSNQKALPVLKVLYRNSNRIQEKGGRAAEVLKAVKPAPARARAIQDHIHRKERLQAEQALVGESADAAFHDLLEVVGEAPEVHRIVMIWRSWELLGVVGKEHAHTMLRQSVRYCVNSESKPYMTRYLPLRKLVPELLERHQLVKREPGRKTGDSGWMTQLSRTIFRSSPADAAGAVATALAEGYSAPAITEAIRVAANELVLRDRGRPKNQTAPNKPEGSIHGDSIGVHASDSANAWCNLAGAADSRHSAVCLILGAYQVAWDRGERGGDFLNWDEYPLAEAAARIDTDDSARLLKVTEAAIRANDQLRATAALARYGAAGHAAGPVFDLMLQYAVSEDGALHAEKYYRTVRESFTATRPEFRWKHLLSLARVTASAFGQQAPGMTDARKLLKLA